METGVSGRRYTVVSGRQRIGLVVEGPTDKAFFGSLNSWFQELGFLPLITKSSGRDHMIRDAEKHLRLHRAKGCVLVLFCLDQNDDACPPETAERLATVRSESDVLVVVMARELEAWLLADEEAIRTASGKEDYRCSTRQIRYDTRNLS